MKRFLWVLIFAGLVIRNVSAAVDNFVIKDIRIEGLQRISAGTVFTYLPIKVGEKFDELRSVQIIKALYGTGFFQDIHLERELQTDVLVVVVDERPSIASIELSGNKQIDSEQLLESMKQVGMAEGRVFKRSLLDQVEQELQRQYYSNGKYSVKIETTVTPLERNRVGIRLEVSEGRVAKIREINIVGNKVFSDKRLRKLLELSTPSSFSFFSSSDQYSKQKLAADLETLRSFYLDQGYLNFDILSTQVTITPDKKYIYIGINIFEGKKYTVKDIKLAGDLVVPVEELEALIDIHPDDIYSRKLIAESTAKITGRLGNEGYAFSNVNTVPDVDKDDAKVSLTFFVDPGKRVYVRRINMFGNSVTSDEVLRREMRQMEGGWFSTEQVNRSRTRLERLGFFSEVNVETPAVPGSNDQVDVNFNVVERPSGNLIGSIGYSETGGVILSASVEQDNFLGTGKKVGIGLNQSDVSQSYRLSYTNPYYTVDGVSRGFSFSSTKTDASEANISDYNTDIDQFSVNYGIPLTENDRIRASIGFANTDLSVNDNSPDVVDDFIAENENKFDTIPVNLSWTHDTRNRAIFPDRGSVHTWSAEAAVPGGDLEFYKLRVRHTSYLPVTKKLTLSIRGEVGYGDGYGDDEELPFFENFFAGGTRSVRGFRENTLGPRSPVTDSSGNVLRQEAIGGSYKVVGNVELIFPVPFAEESKTFRLSAFYDIGNVFTNVDAYDSKELRESIGISAIWMSPLGPLSFSWSDPLNARDEDEVDNFQFSLGGTFF